jgi:hypothetical protein
MLVGELRRRDGRPTARSTPGSIVPSGVARVEDATLEQLQRSCALLLDELTGSTTRR